MQLIFGCWFCSLLLCCIHSLILTLWMCVCVKHLEFSIHKTKLSINRHNFISSFPIWASISFSCSDWDFYHLHQKQVQVYPIFRKLILHHFAFYRRPTLVSVFANWKRNFAVTKKGKEQKQHLVLILHWSITEAEYTRSNESGTTKLLPWQLYSQS